ncbi:MAG TPA: hypothetical protein VHE61_02275 [Opitutaceae bacterium]|nr:hypothetical protein [Opitutaceae bacterium]
MSPRAYLIAPGDNVATLLDDAPAGTTLLCVGAAGLPAPLVTGEAIAHGHKIAVAAIAAHAAVTKFGVRIGHATADIPGGAWVHLHNLASDLDERSATLDLASGAPTDTNSAYV